MTQETQRATRSQPTPQELHVLHVVIAAGCEKQAARTLNLSPHTVNAHLDNLRRKSGCHTLAQLASWASRIGTAALPKGEVHDAGPVQEETLARRRIGWRGVSETQWAQIELLIPSESGKGRRQVNRRGVVNGVLYKLYTGCSWERIPREFGSRSTCSRHYNNWLESGTWERIWRAYFATLSRDEKVEWGLAVLENGAIPRVSIRG